MQKAKFFTHSLVLFLIIWLISAQKINAQNDCFCQTGGGGPNSIGIIPTTNSSGENEIDASGPYFLKVYVHVIRRMNGSGGQSDMAIENAFQQLAEDFNPHNIFFVRGCETIDILVSNEDYLDFDIYCNLWDNPQYQYDDGMSLFFGAEEVDNGAGGVAGGTPSKMFWTAGTWNVGAGSPWNTINTPVVSHEMGHCLGLYHTHHGTITEMNLSCDGQTTTPEQCCELVNGSNANICGDFVIDTNADPREWNMIDYVNCTDDVFWSPFVNNACSVYDEDFEVVVDVNGDIYTPNVNNTMSYNFNFDCLTGFTDGQGERMRQMISFSSVLQSCLFEPDYYSHDIEVNTTWAGNNTPNEGDIYIENELVVEDGATLTISSDVVVRFSEQGKLIIQPNANLILILEGTLTSKGCGHSWKGIEVGVHSGYAQKVVTSPKISI